MKMLRYLLLLSLCSVGQLHSTMANKHLVGAWRAEGNGNDSSGIGATATLANGATYATGKFGKAFSFDGVNDQANISLNTGIKKPFASGAISVSFWIKPASFPTSNYTNIFIIGTTGITNCAAVVLRLYPSGVIGGGIEQLNVGNDLIGPGTAYSTGVWYHIVYVFKNGGSQLLFINGVNVAADTPTLTLDTSAQIYNMAFGGNANTGNSGTSVCGTSGFYNGLLDEVRIYDRVLNDNDIHQLMLNFEPGEY